MALLDICRHFRLKRVPLQRFPPHINPALHYISGNLVRNGSPSSTITLSWHLSNGSCDYHQYDCLRLRPRMGNLGHLPRKCKTVQNRRADMQVKILTALGLGIVVGGRCDSRLHLFLSPIRDVSSSADFPISQCLNGKAQPAYHF